MSICANTTGSLKTYLLFGISTCESGICLKYKSTSVNTSLLSYIAKNVGKISPFFAFGELGKSLKSFRVFLKLGRYIVTLF